MNRLVDLVVRLLPVDARGRYREEIRGDLASLAGVHRLTYLLGVLVTLPALRHSLRRPRVGLDGHRIRLRCRVGLHHWHRHRTEDDEAYRRCDRCDADDVRALPRRADNSIGAAIMGYRAGQ